MNNMPFPYLAGLYPSIHETIQEEIRKLKLEITRLNERITILENKLDNKNKKNYLQKDDNLYMM